MTAAIAPGRELELGDGLALDQLEVHGLYLIHLEPRYLHAGHYLGYADLIDRRVREHLACGSKSSPLLRAAISAGCTLTVARVWPGGSRVLERLLKRSGGLSRHCPTCRAAGDWHR